MAGFQSSRNAIGHWPLAIRHSPFAIRHSPFAIRYVLNEDRVLQLRHFFI